MDRHGWDERYDGDGLVWSAGPNERFASVVADLSPGTALDLGAGEGRNAIWLAREGWDVTAVDFSEVGLATARRRADAAGVGVETVAEDLLSYRPEPASFDLVAVIYLQLDRAERPGVYRAAADAVAPGGTLVVLGHDTTNLTEGYGGPPVADVLFTAEDVVADLDGTGLDVVQAAPVDRVVETDDGPRTAIDALVVARRPRG